MLRFINPEVSYHPPNSKSNFIAGVAINMADFICKPFKSCPQKIFRQALLDKWKAALSATKCCRRKGHIHWQKKKDSMSGCCMCPSADNTRGVIHLFYTRYWLVSTIIAFTAYMVRISCMWKYINSGKRRKHRHTGPIWKRNERKKAQEKAQEKAQAGWR